MVATWETEQADVLSDMSYKLFELFVTELKFLDRN